MARQIRKGDLVQVITGADRTKPPGRVIEVNRETGKLRVEKVRMQKRHLKAGRKGARGGGIIEQEGWIDASNVMMVDADSGKPSRVRIQRDGDRRIRVFAKSGEAVPDPTS